MMTLLEAAQAIGALASGPNVPFAGVSTDSRSVAQGDLFIALKGERFDGHEYIRTASSFGAVAAMVDLSWPVQDLGLPLLRVDDTRLALGRLAQAWRGLNNTPLVAITGSNGKTTLKEMVAAILRAEMWGDDPGEGQDTLLATQGNLNNDIGVPLTLLKLRPQHRYAVIEMGMNHPGEIEYLSRMASPDIAVINNAQRAHLGLLGTIEAVAHAKGEIFAGLRAHGIAIINADDPHAYVWRELTGNRKRIEFALSQPATVSARYGLTAFGSHIDFLTPLGEISTQLQVPGTHNVRNALAACTVAVAFGVRPVSISAGLRAFAGVKGRMQRKSGAHGAILIDDTYNANPDSAMAALDVLAQFEGAKIFVLGDMGEIGPDGNAMHAAIGQYAKDLGIDRLFSLGELSHQAAAKFGNGSALYVRAEDLIANLRPLLQTGVTVLIKGSRFMHMERVVDALAVESAQT
jgi:UDP-N-acetylmuramoyl-tripeptide--D-alanyl-D-alanine ligase